MKRSAFSLIEVMFAVLILGIGLIAILSLFPVAGGIQRDTVDKVQAMVLARSADAIMRGKPMDRSLLTPPVGPNLQHVPNLAAAWPLADRVTPINPSPADVAANWRGIRYWWVPLVRNDPVAGVEAWVFILRRIGDEPLDDTLVAKAGPSLAGDPVVREDGRTVRILTTDNSAAANEWRAASSGSISRGLHVVRVGVDAFYAN